MKLAELNRQIEEKVAAVNTLYDAVGEDEPSAEQYQQVVDLNKQIEELEVRKADAQQKHAEMAGVREKANARLQAMRQVVRPVAFGGGSDGASTLGDLGDAGHRAALKSIGEAFVNDPAYKAWLEDVSTNGHISTNQRLQSPKIEAKIITGGSGTSGGAFVIPDQFPGLVQLPFRPLVLRDVITVATTRSDAVEYVRVTTLTNNAAPVAEATAATGTSGTKPMSDLAFERVTEAVKTIAHWVAATSRALSDAGQLRSLIDTFLRDGLDQALETEMITGDGSGEHFLGILNQPGTTAQAFDTDRLTTTRKARTKVQTVGRARPTGYIMHPLDWEAFDLTQDNEARYYFGGPSILGTPRLWGLPVVETEAMPEGTSVVGDLRQMVLWDRQQTNISVSNSHQDFFTRNLLAILAELRAAFGVLRPAAIVEIDLAA